MILDLIQWVIFQISTQPFSFSLPPKERDIEIKRHTTILFSPPSEKKRHREKGTYNHYLSHSLLKKERERELKNNYWVESNSRIENIYSCYISPDPNYLCSMKWSK